MSNEEQEAFLNEPNVAILTTVDGKGRPHAAPIWYLYDNGVIVISTGRTSQKGRNVARNPNVMLVVDRRTVPYYALMLRGEAEIGPQLSDDDRLRLAVRYLGEKMGRAYVERTSADDSIAIRLRPSKVIEYHGRAGSQR